MRRRSEPTTQNSWKEPSAKKINKNLETYNIKKEELETLDKNRVSNLIQKKINIKRITSLEIKGTTATKIKEMSKNITQMDLTSYPQPT